MADTNLVIGKPAETAHRFWLQPFGRRIRLYARSSNGPSLIVLSINPDGSIHRAGCADPIGAPFKFDDTGRIIID